MKWHTEEPPTAVDILCCFGIKENPFFYVCGKYEHKNKKVLIEASGEEYAEWPLEELIAWTTFDELKNDLLKQFPYLIF